MATDAELTAAGIHLPVGNDYIREGDDAISANARVIWERVEDARFLKENSTAGSDSTLTSLPNGLIAIRSGSIAEAMHLPVAVTGFLQLAKISSGSGIAVFYARRGTGSLEIYTTTLASGGWAEWERSDAGGVVIPDQEGGLPGQVSVWGSSSPAGVVPELANALRPYGVQVHNKARGGQWSSQSVANIGCSPIALPVAGGTIPASGSVEINAADSMLDGVDLYLAAPAPLTGWLGGVYGELVGYGTTFADRGVRFVRTTPGAAVSPSSAPSWVPEVKTPAHLNILGMGKNDLNVGRTSAHRSRLIARKDQAVAYWRSQGQEFLLLGHFVNNGTAASDAGRTQIEADNADSAARYGDNFINMQTLIAGEELWQWTGISPTSEDRAQQSLGNMPPSIQGNGNHLNETGNRYLSWKIAQWAAERELIGQGKPPFVEPPEPPAPSSDWSVDIPLAAGWRTDVDSSVTAYRSGNVVTVAAWRLAVNSDTTGTLLSYTLPTGYRPIGLTAQYIKDQRGADVYIGSSGAVSITNPSKSVSHHSSTFITGDAPPTP